MIRTAKSMFSPRRGRGRRRGGVRILLPLIPLLLVLSCSTYSDKAGKMRGSMLAGDPLTAMADLQKLTGKEKLPYLMEQGLLRYLNGDLAGCQTSFTAAQTVIQDLYTRSLSKEALTMIYNDSAQEYQGEIFERLWVHFYRALGYIAAGQLSEAAVEGRAVTFDARRFSDSGDAEAKYRDDPFLQMFAGWLYEADGELNDAWINYRRAEQLYSAGDHYGVSPPQGLYGDIIRSGSRLGFAEEVSDYRERAPHASGSTPESGSGEVVLLVSTGLIPPKLSSRIDFPIFKNVSNDTSDFWLYASDSYAAWQVGGGDAELDYILSIALPRVADSAGATPRVAWESGGVQGELELGADLGALERQCLEDRYGSVVVRTVARALTKYWSKEKLEEKSKAMGLFADLLGTVTEVADTRSWSTLPEHIHFTRIPLPAGRHEITVRTGARIVRKEVEIQAGGLSFLHLRAY